LFDNALPKHEKNEFLKKENLLRQTIDMFQSESVFFFGRIFSWPPEPDIVPTCFCLRSANKGRTWERRPSVINAPLLGKQVNISRQNTPVIRMPDGKTLL